MIGLFPLLILDIEATKKVSYKTIALSVIGLTGAIAIRNEYSWKITALSVVGYVTAYKIIAEVYKTLKTNTDKKYIKQDIKAAAVFGTISGIAKGVMSAIIFESSYQLFHESIIS